MAVQNDLYAGGTPTLSLPSSSCSSIAAAAASTSSSSSASVGTVAASSSSSSSQHQHQQPQPSAPPASAVLSNGGGGGGISNSQKNTNRMSAPLIGSCVANSTYGQKLPQNSSSSSSASDNASSSSSYAILQNLHDPGTQSTGAAVVAPPLPPRKSSPGVETPSKATAPPPPSSSKSIDNIQCSLDNVPPQTTAPPIPPHVTSSVDTLAEDLMRQQRIATSTTSPVLSLLDEDIVEVGPAETISGVIDTRPLEARGVTLSRQDSASSHYTQLCTTSSGGSAAALANGKRATPAKQSQTTTTTTPAAVAGNGANPLQQSQPLLYANVTINQKDCGTVPYENINLEYIARLMNAGYSKENAITALGISRNNIEMAGDILREFVSKNSA